MEIYEIYQKWIVLPGMALILLVLLLVRRCRVHMERKKEGKESC